MSLIGIAFATSLFPLLAESKSRKSRQQFDRQLKQGILFTLLAVIPAAILIYLLREEIINFFIGTGNFNQVAITSTAAVLGIYALSIPAESLVHILARAFYALHNTFIPVVISIITIVITVFSATILTSTMGVSGIAAGFVIDTAIQALLLIIMLRFIANRVLAR